MIDLSKWGFITTLACFILVLSNCGLSEGDHSGDAAGKTTAAKTTGLTLVDNKGLSAEQVENYHRRGVEIVGMTFSALNTALMNAMQGDSAVLKAIEYCHTAAMPITDSLAEHYGVKVARLAEKNRNPENAIVHAADSEIFQKFKDTPATELRNAETLQRLSDGSLVFYKAIPLQPQCMACHGPVSTIGPDSYSAITALYPNDKAVGFRPGELRGMWRITLARN